MRPSQITDAHLSRTAIAYLRQSSMAQVRENIGSTALQRDLPGTVRDWGWPPERIEVIDDDLGVSGASPGHRKGFLSLLDRMRTGTVGLVAVTDNSRLSRNLQDLADFDEVARRYDVLLAAGTHVIDFRDPNAAFLGTILGANAARENQARVDTSMKARRKKAAAGIATTHPPIGYISVPGGQWIKDPDPRVQDAIELVFEKYLRLGTMAAVVRSLRREEFLLPGRLGPKGRAWNSATMSSVATILTHPAYAGIYEYGRTEIVEPARAGKKARRREVASLGADGICIRDHHEPYIDPAIRDNIQQRLNAAKRRLSVPIGRGNALVQGILRCTRHGLRFKTRYARRTRRLDGTIKRVASYWCMSRDTGTTVICAEMRGERIDRLVESEVLQTLVPPSLDILEEAAREALRTYHMQERAREDELRTAKRAVDHADRALDQVDLAQTRLRKRFAERLDAALERHDEIKFVQESRPLTPPLTFDESGIRELRSLLQDLPTLWRHPHVTAEQRKAVVRRLIKAVHVTPNPDYWHLDIEWTGGARTGLELPTVHGMHSELARLHATGLTAAEIAAELTRRGFVHLLGSATGKPYTVQHVQEWINRWGRQPLVENFGFHRRRPGNPRSPLEPPTAYLSENESGA